jgi:hypothetical protein
MPANEVEQFKNKEANEKAIRLENKRKLKNFEKSMLDLLESQKR